MSYRPDTSSELMSGSLHEASKSLFRFAGGWGNVNGPGFFMFRVLLSGTVSSVIFGMAGASISGAVFGTAGLPFLVCACGGFIFGAAGFYRDALRQAYVYLERYPRLLQLHLDTNFPTRGFNYWRREQLRAAAFSGSWTTQSMLICSWLTAQPALDRLTETYEESIVEEERLKLAMEATVLEPLETK